MCVLGHTWYTMDSGLILKKTYLGTIHFFFSMYTQEHSIFVTGNSLISSHSIFYLRFKKSHNFKTLTICLKIECDGKEFARYHKKNEKKKDYPIFLLFCENYSLKFLTNPIFIYLGYALHVQYSPSPNTLNHGPNWKHTSLRSNASKI